MKDREFSGPDGRMAALVSTPSAPAALIGLLLEDFFVTAVRSPWVIVFALTVVEALFVVGEAVGRRSRQASALTYPEAIAIGLAQATALVPGVSRSGTTMTLGLFLGLQREEAARFSFLMSVPVILGAGALQLLGMVEAGMSG